MDSAEYPCNDCGRSFAGIGPLNYHMRSCRSGKIQLQGALSTVHQFWQARKRRKLNPLPSDIQPTPSDIQPTSDIQPALSQLAPDYSVSPSSLLNSDMDDATAFVSNMTLCLKSITDSDRCTKQENINHQAHYVEEHQEVFNDNGPILHVSQRQPQGFTDMLPQPPPPLLLHLELGLPKGFFFAGSVD